MRIDPVRPADVADAIALWDAAQLTRPWNDPDADLRRALDGPSSTVLAGTEDGRLVATVMVGHDGHRGWVYYLAVAADRRGAGLGATMMRAAERWLADRGVPKLELMIRVENAGAQRFYGAIGYAREDVLVMSRRLTAD